MTDEMEKLKAAMTRATPAPDPETRDAHLRLAQENFDRLQGTASQARPTVSRPLWARLTQGAR
ncbi:MAG: hypothetical protein KJN93_07780, partial [Alphaproteobacteria bacterium]|nr:hypothetical protein [Alphaproteobacteria bacterium]